MSTINDTDQFLVQRGTSSFKQSAVDLMSTIQDTDLMLIQRGTDSFNVTCLDVKDQLGGGGTPVAPVLASVVLSQNAPIDSSRFTSKSFTSTTANSGGDATTLEMTGAVTGALNIKAGSDPITTNAYPGTSSTDVVLTLEGETNLGDVIQVGDTVTANASYTPETSEIVSTSGGEVSSASFSTNGTDQVNFFSLADTEILTFITIMPGSAGGTGCVGRQGGSPRGGRGGGAGGTGAIYYRRMTKKEYTDEFASTTYTQEIANNFNGQEIKAQGAVGRSPWTSNCSIYPGGEVGPNGVVMDYDFTFLNSLFPDEVTFSADSRVGKGGNDPTYGGPFGGDTGGGAQGGNAGVLITSSLGSVPDSGRASQGGKSARGDDWPPQGACGWGAGACGGNGGGSGDVGTDDQPGAPGGVGPGINLVFIGTLNTVLHLPDEKDIQLFQTGDVVETGNDGEDVTVIAADVSAKTVTVNGGKWDTSNQSEVWSSGLSAGAYTFFSSSGPEKAFNGDVTNGATVNHNITSLTFSPPADIVIDNSFEWFTSLYSSGAAPGTSDLTLDGTTVNLGGRGHDQWLSIPEFVGKTISSSTPLVMRNGDANQRCYFRGLKVDGKLLVDAVNDSQVWSNPENWAVANIESGSVDNIFNDNLTEGLVFASDGSAEWTIPSSYDIKGNLEVSAFVGTNDDSLPQFFYNGVWNTPIEPNAGATGADYTWDTGSNVVTGFKFAGSAGSSPAVTSIYLNGKLLVDPGVRDLGDTTVSTLSPKQGSGTVSDITGAQVTVTPFTDNCFKEGQHLTVNKTVLVDPVTDSISGYNAGTKTITLSGDKDLLQFANGDPVSMVNADGSPAVFEAETSAITTITENSIAGANSGWNSGGANLYNGTGGTASSPLGSNGQYRGGSISFSPALPAGFSSVIYYEFNGSSSSTRPMNVNINYSDGTTDTIATNVSAGSLRSHPIDSAKQLSGISWSAQMYNESLNIRDLKIDNQTLDLSGFDSTMLEFTDATNLQYFNDGDVVQSDGASVPVNGFTALCSGNVYGGSWGYGNAFNGSTSNACSPAEGESITITFPSPGIKCTESLSYYQYLSNPSGCFVKVNGVTTNPTTTGTKTLSVPASGYIETIEFNRTSGSNAIDMTSIKVDGVELLNSTGFQASTFSVVGTPTLSPPQMTVSGGTWSNGDTITKSISGAGTVSSIDPVNKKLVLFASNDEWLDGYHVATPTKPIVATTAYLQFSATGQVTGYQATPVEPRAMDNKVNPTLTFPATFPDTGQAPDVEFPDANAYIQTSVQLKNDAGNSATVASNKVVPQTNVRSIGPGEVKSNVDDVKAMGMQLATHDQRIADHTAAKRQQVAADLEANLRRYTP